MPKLLKQFVCVQTKNYNEIGSIIETYQTQGWDLHTYQATGDKMLYHHLLFWRYRQ